MFNMYLQNKVTSKPKLPYLIFISALSLYATSAFSQQCQTLVWEDNFTQTSLDTNAWEIQTGDGCDQGAGMCGWGNSELQSYQTDNITLANGIMTIEARKERVKSTQYTSGRIRTANMAASGDWSFGRFEARMKVPDGQGMWPAFWMLPTNPANVWPISGEIDIFESVGQSANISFGTIHYGQPWPDNSHTGGSMLMQPGKWSDDFHTYAVEWELGEIRWYIDNMLYSVKTPADVSPEDWPFDGRNNFHLILNLAVGGTWGGTVDDSSLPQTLAVDFVRVYAGSQPNLTGNHLPSPGSTETYAVDNSAGNTTWDVTGGIISGTGDVVEITWDTTSANTIQTLTATSGSCQVSTQIYVGKNLTTETILEDYNGTSNMSVTFSNGIYTEGNGVLTYTRDAASQWDVVSASTSTITDANAFIIGDKAFQLDINNVDQNLIGKEIIIQLEDSATATPDNYPTGRHSKYNAYIENANGWQTLKFSLVEQLDANTADTDVDNILFLIDPDNFTNDTYTIDNIVILGVNSPSETATTLIVDSVTTGTQAAVKGKKYGTANVIIVDDLGNSVEGASVQGNFSGSWNETALAITDASGIASFTTTTSLSGGVTVNFCVNDVIGTLPFDATTSSNTCQ